MSSRGAPFLRAEILLLLEEFGETQFAFDIKAPGEAG